MLETIGTSLRHRPGSLMLYVGSLQRHASLLMARASEALAEVSARFGHTGYISMRDGREVVGVVDFEGTKTLRVVSNIGRRLPAHLSATGRTLLARLPDDMVDRLYDGHDGLDSLRRALEVVRAQGFAISQQESTPGVDAVAIGVCDPTTTEALSLCIVYPHGHVDDAGRDTIISALAAQAVRIAKDFGDTSFVAPRLQQEEIL